MDIESSKDIPTIQKCIAIFWPSFLTAIIATGLFFSAFEPRDLIPFNSDVEISDLGFYTIGFFFFWIINLLSGIGTLYFTVTNCLICANPNKPKT